MKPVKPPFRTRQLQICTNQRPAGAEKPSCGYHGSVEARERLKAAVKAAGRKGELMVVGTTCLGYCPASGYVAAILPDNEWMLCDHEDEPALLARLLDGPPSA